jgi:hypothetical protein
MKAITVNFPLPTRIAVAALLTLMLASAGSAIDVQTK